MVSPVEYPLQTSDSSQRKKMNETLSKLSQSFQESLQYLDHHLPNYVVPSKTSKDDSAARGSIIYILRTKSRHVNNVIELLISLQHFAQTNQYHFYVHDDRKRHTIDDQILLFQDAAMVIAPHGAGLLFTAFVPQHACILELMPTVDYPRCYARIAYLRQVLYYEMILLEDSHRLSEEVLKVHIQHCHQYDKVYDDSINKIIRNGKKINIMLLYIER